MGATNVRRRVTTALLLVALVVAVTWFDQPLPWLTIAVAIWGLLALNEFYGLVQRSKPDIHPLRFFGAAWVITLIISPHLPGGFLNPVILTSGLLISLGWYLFANHRESAFSSWAWTLAGVMYTGFLLSYLSALRLFDNGTGWVLLALFTTFASDSAAYFVGSIWGRNKIAPSISPKKTWEGAIGGLAGAMMVSPLVVFMFSLPVSWAMAVALGFVISALGQAGDLVESLFKRNVNTKDSGKSFPGHGGFLDRMDSVVVAVIVVYYYIVWLT